MDHYQTLAVERTATADEIKKAYRKLAMLHHPDRNPGDAIAETKFKEVQAAYDVLSNPEKKTQYDRFGSPSRSPSSATSPPKKPETPKPKTKEDFERERVEKDKKKRAASGDISTFSQSDLDAIDCTFFGGSGQGRSIMTQLKLTPAEMKKGGQMVIPIKKRTMCPACVGDGEAMKMCLACRGKVPETAWCLKCEGAGATQSKCPSCNGEGVKPWTIAEVRVSWSPNVQPGHQINILGEGEICPRKFPGNLRVVIVQ